MAYYPTKPPTPEEYTVLAIGVSAGSFALGLLGLADYFFNPPGNPDTLQSLFRLSWFFLACGVLVATAYWVTRRLTD